MSTTRVYEKHGSLYYVEDLEARNASGRPKQKWHKLCRVDEGEAALHAALAAFHGKEPEPAGNMKARIEEFSAAHMRTLSFGVRKEYERNFVVIGEAFADFDDHEVRAGDVLEFLNENFAEHPTARGHYKARISTFFGWCVLKGYVPVNPCREVKLRRPAKRKGRMNAGVYWAMKDALPEIGQLFLELAYLSRQRPTEIRLLRESWIGADRIRFVPTKTERSSAEYVEIARSPRMNAIIERLREMRPARMKHRKVIPIAEQRDAFLLLSEDGAPYTKSGLNTIWRRAREAAAKKLPDLASALLAVTTRDIRPYALSQMEKDGYTVEAIREAAAHTTTGQTDAYLNQHRERFSAAVLNEPARPA